jgi:hypothetical protein
LGKALEVHSISLTQAFKKKQEEVEARRQALMQQADDKWKLVVKSLVRIDVAWLEKNIKPLTTLIDAYRKLFGVRKSINVHDFLNYDEAEDWTLFRWDNTKGWYRGYGHTRFGSNGIVLPTIHTVGKRVNLKSGILRWDVSLRLIDVRSEHNPDVGYEYPLSVKLNEYEFNLIKEIEALCKQLMEVDAQRADLAKRASNIPAQAEAMKVKVFRSELAKFEGGEKLLADLDASIASTIEGTLPQLADITV